jgi:DnaJ-domain-containing protein 1
MTFVSYDALVIMAAAIVGFTIVWFVMSVWSVNRQRVNKDSPSDETPQSGGPLEWFQVLEVSEGATIAEIHTAYRKKMMQYHPDRVESLGSEFKQLAELRTKEISQAYEIGRRLRG